MIPTRSTQGKFEKHLDLRHLLDRRNCIRKRRVLPKEWKPLKDNGIDLRMKGHRYALLSDSIICYIRRLDRHKNRQGEEYFREFYVIHDSQVSLFFEIAESMTESHPLIETSEHLSNEKLNPVIALQDKSADVIDLISVHRHALAKSDLPYDQNTFLLLRNLDDFDKADPSWLNDAYLAIGYAMQDENSVMKKWVSKFDGKVNVEDQWISFSQCLDYTMGIY